MKTDAKQVERFREAAREVGANESDDAPDKIMGKLDLTKSGRDPKPAMKRPHGRSGAAATRYPLSLVRDV